MPAPVHPAFVEELARLARGGVGAAEARRLLIPLATRLRIPRPGYTAVLEIVQQHPPPLPPRPGPGITDSLILGRMPSVYEATETKARARVHMEIRKAERAARRRGTS